MGSEKKIVSGVVWQTMVNIVNAIYGFVAVPILINYFGKAEYGLIGLAMSVNVYMRLMDMGFNSTNVRFFSTWLSKKEHDKLKRGFQTSLSFYGTIGLINTIILLGIAFFSESIFNVTPEQDEILKHLFYILAVSAFCSWFSSCFDQLIKSTENVAWLQKRSLITKLLMVAVLVATVCGKLSIELYYALTCLAALVIVPLSVKKIKVEAPYISFLPKWDWTLLKEMLPYCMNIFSFSLFQFSFYNLRPVFLGMQGSVESVADYRILNGIVHIVVVMGGAFTGVLLPSTSKVVATNNLNAFYKVAYNGTKYVSILLCFCCFGMMTIGSEALTIYVGEEYLYLIPWLNVWLLCTLGSHNQAISSLILAGNDVRALSYSSAAASIVGLILSWLLIPSYQIGGVCIAFVVYIIMQMLFYYCYYWPKKMKINSLKVFTYDFAPYVLLGLLLYIALQRIPDIDFTVYRLVVKGALFAITYAICVFFMISKEDKEFFLSVLKKKKNK